MTTPFCVLAIAGSDSGGGAGIQSDQRTIRALGGHALTAVTAVTAQDTVGISAWAPVPDALIRAQVESALKGFEVAAAKTGLLAGNGAIKAVAAALAKQPALPVVVDPVLASSSGTRFLPAGPPRPAGQFGRHRHGGGQATRRRMRPTGAGQGRPRPARKMPGLPGAARWQHPLVRGRPGHHLQYPRHRLRAFGRDRGLARPGRHSLAGRALRPVIPAPQPRAGPGN